jgi:hypothetical protein
MKIYTNKIVAIVRDHEAFKLECEFARDSPVFFMKNGLIDIDGFPLATLLDADTIEEFKIALGDKLEVIDSTAFDRPQYSFLATTYGDFCDLLPTINEVRERRISNALNA